MVDNRRKRKRGPKEALTLSAALFAVGAVCVLIGGSRVLTAVGVATAAAGWLLPVLLVVRGRARPVQSVPREAQRAAVRSVVSAVEDARAKQSRHEYHQERSLDRIEAELRRLNIASGSAALTLQGEGIDVLFVTSNGAGLGHISRLLAVAKQLPSDRSVEFLTLSTAYRQVANTGTRIHYFPSSEAAGVEPKIWNQVFRGYFLRLVRAVKPRIVVFDGTWVYTGITDVCRALDIPLVWMQRGLWKPEADARSPQRHAAATVVDEVIIPGDYSGAELVDVGPNIVPHHVGPIVMTTREALLSRDEACDHLGLDPAGKYVLFNLGGGALGDPSSIAYAALELLRENAPDVTPVQVVSPLTAPSEQVPGLLRVSAYPVMVAAAAFEFVIAAAGYNSVQEIVALGVPSILVPNTATRTDDQVRRARDLERKLLCLVAEDAEELARAIHDLSQDHVRTDLARRLRNIESARGASDAAAVLEEIRVRAGWMDRADVIGGTEER